jgi:hypothetical protein
LLLFLWIIAFVKEGSIAKHIATAPVSEEEEGEEESERERLHGRSRGKGKG